MSQLLSLRHYHHEQIAHSHDHAQLVFGLSGRLDFEVAGHGCQVSSMSFAVLLSRPRASATLGMSILS